LECEWQVCVSSTDALVIIIIFFIIIWHGTVIGTVKVQTMPPAVGA